MKQIESLILKRFRFYTIVNSFLQNAIKLPIILTQGEKDDKIIAVCADDPEYKHYTDIKELAPHRLSEIRRFFEDCILSLALTNVNFSDYCLMLVYNVRRTGFLTHLHRQEK